MCILPSLGRSSPRPRQHTGHQYTPWCFLADFHSKSLKRWPSAKYCMLAPWTWWDHISQWVRMASLWGLLMHFIGVNKVDSVRGTCTFKGQKVAL
jgi:hypothetical protein